MSPKIHKSATRIRNSVRKSQTKSLEPNYSDKHNSPRTRLHTSRPNSKILGPQIPWRPNSARPLDLVSSTPAESVAKPTIGKCLATSESNLQSIRQYYGFDLADMVRPSGESCLSRRDCVKFSKLWPPNSQEHVLEKSLVPTAFSDLRDQNIFVRDPNKFCSSNDFLCNMKENENPTQGDIHCKTDSDHSSIDGNLALADATIRTNTSNTFGSAVEVIPPVPQPRKSRQHAPGGSGSPAHAPPAEADLPVVLRAEADLVTLGESSVNYELQSIQSQHLLLHQSVSE